jgi:hypothetical protein
VVLLRIAYCRPESNAYHSTQNCIKFSLSPDSASDEHKLSDLVEMCCHSRYPCAVAVVWHLIHILLDRMVFTAFEYSLFRLEERERKQNKGGRKERKS